LTNIDPGRVLLTCALLVENKEGSVHDSILGRRSGGGRIWIPKKSYNLLKIRESKDQSR
jgi:hypothetical protein